MAADKPTPKSDWWHDENNVKRGREALFGSSEYLTTFWWHDLRYGKDRRNEILQLMKEGMQVTVNRSNAIGLSKDKDLLDLLKRNKIKRTTRYHGTVNYTVLVYNHELDSTS